MRYDELVVESLKRPQPERWKYFKEHSTTLDGDELERASRLILIHEAMGIEKEAPPMAEAAAHKFPRWAPIAGFVLLALAIFFIAGITVYLLISGVQLPAGVKSLLTLLVSITLAASLGFLGGNAAANGNLPLPGGLQNPLGVSVTGGVAVFVITLIVTNLVLPSAT